MANPEQQGLKHATRGCFQALRVALMANPEQQGLKLQVECLAATPRKGP